MGTASTRADLDRLYRDTHLRLVELLGELSAEELDAPVPACPGWSVAEVAYHLVAVAEDALAGRLTAPPSDQQTAEQVARFRGRDLDEVVGTWAELAPRFEETIQAFEVWPAVLDVLAHEQDIRGALDRPGARDTEGIRVGSERLLTWLRPPVPMVVRVEDGEYRVGPAEGEPVVRLDTTRFEAFRFRLGRRSRRQLAALDWTEDPGPVLDHLAVFGPSPEDILE